jgi:tryptophanyl-tRNA synthetase
MSKSDPDVRSRILLTDSYTQIRSKLRGAVTDSVVGISYDPVNRPGISNLLTILAACRGEDVESIAIECRENGHGQLKDKVVEAVEETLKSPREQFERLRKDPEYIDRLAKEGSAKAKELSSNTLKIVRKRVGLGV